MKLRRKRPTKVENYIQAFKRLARVKKRRIGDVEITIYGYKGKFVVYNEDNEILFDNLRNNNSFNEWYKRMQKNNKNST